MLNSREVWGYLTLHDVTTTGFTPLLKMLYGFPHSESRLLLIGGLVTWDTWWKSTGQCAWPVGCYGSAYCCSEHSACCGRSAACTKRLSRSPLLLWVLRSVGWFVIDVSVVYGCHLQGSSLLKGLYLTQNYNTTLTCDVMSCVNDIIKKEMNIGLKTAVSVSDDRVCL